MEVVLVSCDVVVMIVVERQPRTNVLSGKKKLAALVQSGRKWLVTSDEKVTPSGSVRHGSIAQPTASTPTLTR